MRSCQGIVFGLLLVAWGAGSVARGDVFEIWFECPTGGSPAPLDFGDDFDPCSPGFFSAYQRLERHSPHSGPRSIAGGSALGDWGRGMTIAAPTFKPFEQQTFSFEPDDDGRSRRARIQPEAVVPEPTSALVFAGIGAVSLWRVRAKRVARIRECRTTVP